VSKKTIAFTMPQPASRPRERAPLIIDAVAESAAEAEGATRPDEWVSEQAPHEPPQAVAPRLPFAFEARTSLTIDLAAERSLTEAISLSFLTPFALGWFWWVHAATRRPRLWGL
jgi:hypothetical protein